MQQVRIGRSIDNDVVLDNPTVSRHHAVITQVNDRFLILDNDSSNGTFINGIRIQGESRLNQSDILKLGTLVVPWRSYFSNHHSTTKTQFVDQDRSEDAYSSPKPHPTREKSLNLNHLTKPRSFVRKTFGILFLILGMGGAVLGLAAMGKSQQTYDDNNIGINEEVQIGNEYENNQSREEGAAGVAILVGGFSLLLTGIILLSTKSRSQRRYEAEIELLKKMQ
ncbi:MAG: sigma-54 dependent transcription regulator [Bacteroidota bacterium]|jgi:hypothetical protein